jgi:hypothetical protein
MLLPGGGWAWTEHPLISYPVLASLAEVREAPAVEAESIESFLSAEERKLEAFLAEEEAWARANLAWYPPLPDALAFRAQEGADGIRRRFCHAIRVNPEVRFSLYLGLVPGADTAGRPGLRPAELSILRNASNWDATAFVSLRPGERVRPLEVAVSATDDPDLPGLDVGLFADNGTDFGRAYGFGNQPFGNPNLEHGSQAPFHMGFYHESDGIYAIAGFLKKTYPEYRIRLYKRLAQFAFRTGHPYWGWRFTGMGLHHLADLAQPYHAVPLPGVSDARLVWISLLDRIGIHSPKNDAVQLVSNRHMTLETFVQTVLQRAYRAEGRGGAILTALQSADEVPSYADTVPRQVIARLSAGKAEETDRVLQECMPVKFVSDPSFEVGTSPERLEIVERVSAERGEQAVERQILLVRDLLLPFAAWGRAYVRAVLSGN